MASSLTATVEKQEAMEGESTDQQVDPRVSGEAAAETSSTKMKDNETTGIVVSPDEETRKRKHAAVETTTDSDINPEAPPAGEDAPADGNTAAATNDETPPTEDAGTQPTQPAESKEAERKDSNATQTETEGDEKSKEPESSKEEQVKADKEAVVEDNTEETEESDQKAAPKPPVLPPRPIKRARTAYFIFIDEKRPQVQSEHPGEGVATVARIMGQLWATLTPEEKESYQQKSALERERVAKELEEYKAAGGVIEADGPSNQREGALVFPMARIRKICKLDPEVRGLSKEALLLVTKCAELATSKLGKETVRVAQLQNRRKLLPEDIANVCSHREQFLFLKEDVKDLVKEMAANQGPKAKKGDTAREAAATGSKPLTSYFGASK